MAVLFMRAHLLRLTTILLISLGLLAPSLADDWIATKLRGEVFAQVGGKWVQLQRGDVVPDARLIRTGDKSRVTFQRDKETIELAADTQAQIFDKDGEKFTTVKQHFGMVSIEAEVRNVQHFSVETPFLAAVVKGTKFIVRSNDAQAIVNVVRGKVHVDDEVNGLSVDVGRGQSAGVAVDRPLAVAGYGELPQVVAKDGTPFVAPATSASSTGTPLDDAGPNALIVEPDQLLVADTAIQEPGNRQDGGKPGKDREEQGKSGPADKPSKDDDKGKPAKDDDKGKPSKDDDKGKPPKDDDKGKPAKDDDKGKSKDDDKDKPGNDKGDKPGGGNGSDNSGKGKDEDRGGQGDNGNHGGHDKGDDKKDDDDKGGGGKGKDKD